MGETSTPEEAFKNPFPTSSPVVFDGNGQCEIMQFTGLLDKNGKEIYEGDIVRSEQWEPSTYKIAFDRGAFYLATKNDEEVADIKYAERFEVIGNIYDNPELLPLPSNP
jgi:uncharacterized phage protein (TIGR01671 family)